MADGAAREASCSGRALGFGLGLAAPSIGAALNDALPWRFWQDVLGASVLGLCVYVYLRASRGRQWRWIAYCSGVAVWWAGFFALILLVSEAFDRAERANLRDFDAEAWRAAEIGKSETRVWMVDDLLAHHSPVGRPVAEIDELLGPDDGVHGTRYGTGYFEDWDRVWWLGLERAFYRIDSEWLVLRVGKDGRVTEARDVHD